MPDTPINKMDFKQLRAEVQLLRDELAIAERKYEDILYNLDIDNFSDVFRKKQNGMVTSIEQNAKGIKLAASALAGTREDVSQLFLSASAINLRVSSVEDDVSSLSSEFSLTADEIYARVSSVEDGIDGVKTTQEAIFTITSNGFYLDGNETKFTGVIYLTDDNFNNKFSIYYGDGSDDMGTEYVAMWDTVNGYIPLVLGEEGNVYLGTISNQSIVATRGWVEKQGYGSGGGTVEAVFG